MLDQYDSVQNGIKTNYVTIKKVAWSPTLNRVVLLPLIVARSLFYRVGNNNGSLNNGFGSLKDNLGSLSHVKRLIFLRILKPYLYWLLLR